MPLAPAPGAVEGATDPRTAGDPPPPANDDRPYTPAQRLAAELWLRGLRSRPRRWRTSSEEVARQADRDATARGALLFYAAAIARDRGLHADADMFLARAAEAGQLDPVWAQELELQLAMSEALERRDVAAARARLERLPPHPTQPASPLLAQAALLAAEGRAPAAREALQGWLDANRAGGDHLFTGNLWALERIEERLRASGVRVRLPGLGALRRLFDVVVGLPLAAAFSGLAAVLFTNGFESARSTGAGALVSLGLGLLVTYALWWFGLSRVIRGLRAPRRPSAATRTASRGRTWIPAAAVPALLLAVGWAAAGGLRAFLLLEGSPSAVAIIAWQVLAVWIAWVVVTAIHEAAHALVALAVGARVYEVALGKLVLVTRRPWRLVFRDELPASSGHVRPGVGAPWSRLRHAAIAAAGPVTSASASVLLGMALTVDNLPVVTRVLWTGALVGCAHVLLAVFPRLQGDFEILRDVLRGRFWFLDAGSQAARHIADGCRARAWRVSAAELEAAARGSGERTGWGLVLAATRALDGEDPSRARRLLEEVVADAATERLARKEALLQLALVSALHGGDAPGARRAIAEALRAGAGEYAALAEAAAALAAGERLAARTAYARWCAHVDASASPEYTRIGNHWAIDRLAAECRAAVAGPDGRGVRTGGA